MKYVFGIIIVIHALIHILGFVKGFNLKNIKELTLPISKRMGVLWLITTLLFLVFGVMYFSQMPYAWLSGFAAVLTSQILIIVNWKDAKFGTIPNLIILVVSFVYFGFYLLKHEFTNHVNEDLIINNELSTEILTESDIAHLPTIVQHYLHYTKSVGQPKVKNFRAEFVGKMRGNSQEDYMNLESVQYNFYQNPARYFFMEASKMELPATGLHLYQQETATFQVYLLNWLKVVDAKGDKMNQAETVTLFNDMCFIAPATLIDKRITWELINDTTVKGIFTNGSISISAILYFTQQGELTNFISNDRYDTDGKTYHNYPWETPVQDYKMINGYFLASKAQLIYQKPEGNFTYGELEYKSVTYNVTQLND